MSNSGFQGVKNFLCACSAPYYRSVCYNCVWVKISTFVFVNLSVHAMVLSTFYHNTLMKAQAQRLNVPENCEEYKPLLEIWCVVVTRSQRQMVIRMNPFTMELSGCTTITCNGEQSRMSVCCLQLVSYLPVVCSSLHFTSLERTHICEKTCDAHAYLPCDTSFCSTVGPLVPRKELTCFLVMNVIGRC